MSKADGDARRAKGRAAQEQTFERYRTALQDELSRFASLVSLYVKLNELREHQAVRLAPGSFSTIDDALYRSIVIDVVRLFGRPRHDREWNLHSFLHFISANLWIVSPEDLQRRKGYPLDHWLIAQARAERIDAAVVKADRARLAELPALDRFQMRRDKREAHLDKTYLGDSARLHRDAPIDFGDVRRMYEEPKEIFNRYSAAYDGNVYALDPVNTNDIEWVLDLAAQGLEAFRQAR